MDVAIQLKLFGHILLAAGLGALIGLEREFHHNHAGIRTYAAVSLGACLFAILSTHVYGPSFYHSMVDPSRIAAQIVSGVSFIGAGIIFRQGLTTNGLTTAATIWATAAVGMAIAFDWLLVGILSTLLLVLILAIGHTRLMRKLKEISSAFPDD